ncbi:hypothetical protein LSCM1_01364 [Leishmania martiniquensis]|uniref:Ribosomal RNA methyltransferase FtsJ domain-containing protein n=1 Tax=Leishmania martiniquensis TaxID=1580590 RepID=A0A836KHV1_9TRYP|nr:hypothetical protein LSCM1_01364 [Leishmania martiniquensis]
MYRCQSALKLIELHDRYEIFHRFRPSTVVDLAAAPGGFAQAALELMHLPKNAPHSGLPPLVIAVDQRPIDPMPGLVAVRGDILQHQQILRAVEGVFSDATAPGTRPPPLLSCAASAAPLARSVDMVFHDGVSVVKGQRAFSVTYAQNQMALSALLLASKLFQHFGPTPRLPTIAAQHSSSASPPMLSVCFVSKVLQGQHFAQVLAATRALFRYVRACKPLASRPESLEWYVVATHFQLATWQQLTAPHTPTLQPRRDPNRSAKSASLFSMPPAPDDCSGAHRIVWNCFGCGRTCVGCQPCGRCGPYRPVERARRPKSR